MTCVPYAPKAPGPTTGRCGDFLGSFPARFGRAPRQRYVGSHFSIIFEIHFSAVKLRHRLAHPLRTFSTRIAEGRIGEKRNTWLIAETPRNIGGLLCYVCDLDWIGQFVH